MPTITLTDEQTSTLTFYLKLTEKYRKDELKTCTELSQIKKEDGTATFPNMVKNAIWWKNTHRELEEIRRIIENASRQEVKQ